MTAPPAVATSALLPPPITIAGKPALPGTLAYGEIKPHNVAQIQAGLRKLWTVREQYRRRHKQIPPAYLLTYRYTAGGPVSAYLLRPTPQALDRAVETLRPGERPEDWLRRLGTWWTVLQAGKGPTYTLEQWRDLLGPAVFGSFIEPYLRRTFFRWSKTTPRNPAHVPITAGVDLWWDEVAEFLHELSDELAAWPSPERR
jgi:hypothetical protein